METETLHLIISTAAVLLAGLLGAGTNAFFTQRTTREDRQAAIEADANRWLQTQQAEHRIWVRGEKLRVVAAFLSAVDESYMEILSENAVSPRELLDGASPAWLERQRNISQRLAEILLVAPDLKDGARAVYDAHYPLLTFLSSHPGEFTEELQAKFEPLRKIFSQTRGSFIYDAGAALGTVAEQ
jgi:predicted ribosomally synthesized peptide with SipW-like signal peptide